MKSRYIYLITLIASLGIALYYPELMLNPEPIHRSHQDLLSKDGCNSCHRPPFGPSEKLCLGCHQKIPNAKRAAFRPGTPSHIERTNDFLDDKIDFHSKLQSQNCLQCHTEHKGEEGKIHYRFSHNQIEIKSQKKCSLCHFQSDSKIHQRTKAPCASCHNVLDWDSVRFTHPKGKLNCLECHKKPVDSFHKKENDNCASCHNTTTWHGASIDHSRFFRFDKHHRKCSSCHQGQSRKEYTCYGCHKKRKIWGEHIEEGITDFDNCADCHKSSSEREAKQNYRILRQKGIY